MTDHVTAMMTSPPSPPECAEILTNTITKLIEHGKHVPRRKPAERRLSSDKIEECTDSSNSELDLASPPQESLKMLQEEYADIHFRVPKRSGFGEAQEAEEADEGEKEEAAEAAEKGAEEAKQEAEKDHETQTEQTILHLYQKFSLKQSPSLGIGKYIQRLLKHLNLSSAVLLAAGHYIYNLTYNTSLVLTELNCHRIVMVAIRIACKLLEDLNHKIGYTAKIAGVKPTQMNRLETIMLFLLDFDLKVDGEILQRYIDLSGRNLGEEIE